jgi:hypothetical protein
VTEHLEGTADFLMAVVAVVASGMLSLESILVGMVDLLEVHGDDMDPSLVDLSEYSYAVAGSQQAW